MGGSVRSILLMLLGPPVVLLLWAHLIRPNWLGWDWPVMITAVLLGLVGIGTSPWRLEAKVTLLAAYLALSLVAVPFLGLLAVCSTGDCL